MSTRHKFLVIVPNIQVSAEHEKFLKGFFQEKVGDGTEIGVVSLSAGPASIETYFDEAIAIPDILKNVKKAQKENYDAVVVDCFKDPGVSAGRELVKVPVIGPGECSMHLAALLGHRMSIISPGPEKVLKKAPPRIQWLGFENQFASLRNIGLSVLELGKDAEVTKSRILKCAKRAQDEDEADVIVFGCTGMARFAESLQAALDIPVIEPMTTALKIAEDLVDMGISHSKIAYPVPSKKQRTGFEVLKYLRD